MKRILASEEGDSITLGAPAPGRAVIKVDALKEPAPWTIALQSLEPGASVPVHRVRDWDEAWFVHKGQGKAMVGGATTTVVPGTFFYAPRQTWFGLKNTGTGVLQALVIGAPAGLDGFYRELSSLGAAPDADALQRVVGKFGIEMSSEALPAGPPPGRHRGRGRGRGRGRPDERPAADDRQEAPAVAVPGTPSKSGMSPEDCAPPMTAHEAPAAGPAQPGEQREGRGGRRHRRRRRGGRGGRGGASPQAQQQQPAPGRQAPQAGPAVSSLAPAAAAGQPVKAPAKRSSGSGRSERQGGRGGGRSGGRRFGRVKEVYMGGKWVRVSGDGPVVSSGHDAAKPEDDE